MKDDKKQTFEEAQKALKDRFDDQSLLEQASEILRYLQSAHPAQTVVPQGRVDLLKRSLPGFKDKEEQISKLADFILVEFPDQIQDGGVIDDAIRLLKSYRKAIALIRSLDKSTDRMMEILREAKS